MYGKEPVITLEVLDYFKKKLFSNINEKLVFKAYRVNTSEGITGGQALTGDAITLGLGVATNLKLGGIRIGESLKINSEGRVDVADSVYNASTLGGHAPSYYLDYNNFTNIPELADKVHNHTTLTDVTSIGFFSGAVLLSEGVNGVKLAGDSFKMVKDDSTFTVVDVRSDAVAVSSSSAIKKYTFDKPIAGNIEGNASTAGKLLNPITINGVQFDGSGDLTITASPTAHKHDWSDLTGLPATFPPSAHNHNDLYYPKSEMDDKLSAIQASSEWKPSVPTYSDIATTYPNPQDGWTVNVNDTNITYRYNGTEWIAISANAITAVTAVKDGLMTKEMFNKFETLEPHPTGDGNLHVPATGNSNTNKVLMAGNTAGAISWKFVSWTDLINVPGTFTPAPHSHNDLDSATANNISNTLVKRDSHGNIAVNNISGDLMGNASTSTKFKNPININGVPFDGSTSITINAKPDAHTHLWKDITDRPGIASSISNGLMSPAMYEKLDKSVNYVHPTNDGYLHVPATGSGNNKKVLTAGSTPGDMRWAFIDWSNIDNIPSLAPSNHRHDDLYAAKNHTHTGVYAPTVHSHAWADITNRPESYPPSDHSHSSISTSRNGGFGIEVGTGQGAAYTSYTMRIKSYRAIGYTPMNSTEATILMDVTTGDMKLKGTLSAPKIEGAWYKKNDYAELFEIDDKNRIPEAGDIVALDMDSDEERYILADCNSMVVAGVVSNEYAMLIGGEEFEGKEYDNKKYTPIALAGRVHVKVTGEVVKGDKIVPSEILGVGRRFDKIKDDENKVVGVAIAMPVNGKVRILVK